MSVRFTARSARQIDEALAYLSDRSPTGAAAVADRIGEAIDVLSRFPLTGRMTTRRGVRRLGLSPYPYVIFYRLADDGVLVLRFIHASRRTAR